VGHHRRLAYAMAGGRDLHGGWVEAPRMRHLIEPRAVAPRRAHRTNLLLPPQHQKRVEAPGTHQDG